MKKRIRTLIAAVIAILVIGAGTTYAYIVSSSRPVQNTFTVGSIDISLEETTGDKYKIVPGTVIHKNPTVTVSASSETCWLFVELQKGGGFDSYMSYEIADGWLELSGVSNVYYREVLKTDTDMSFSVLKNNEVAVYNTLTEEDINAIIARPTLKFTAYAIQQETIDSPALAWEHLKMVKE